jgi:hypothetical protein
MNSRINNPFVVDSSFARLYPDTLRGALAPEIAERLSFLFRASLKDGRIHPLYLPILRYRHSQADA